MYRVSASLLLRNFQLATLVGSLGCRFCFLWAPAHAHFVIGRWWARERRQEREREEGKKSRTEKETLTMGWRLLRLWLGACHAANSLPAARLRPAPPSHTCSACRSKSQAIPFPTLHPCLFSRKCPERYTNIFCLPLHIFAAFVICPRSRSRSRSQSLHLPADSQRRRHRVYAPLSTVSSYVAKKNLQTQEDFWPFWIVCALRWDTHFSHRFPKSTPTPLRVFAPFPAWSSSPLVQIALSSTPVNAQLLQLGGVAAGRRWVARSVACFGMLMV